MTMLGMKVAWLCVCVMLGGMDTHEYAAQLASEGKTLEALAAIDEAIVREPDNYLAKTYRATLLLLHGDLEQGFAEYEWRWKCGPHKNHQPKSEQWDGAPLPGQTLLLYSEQGFGDLFQFVRYAALAKQRCGRVVLCTRPATLPLMRLCPLLDDVCVEGGDLPARAAFSALMTLPRTFGTTLETIPSEVPYLKADPALIDHWRLLRKNKGLLVGVNWKGSDTSTLSRDIPKSHFLALQKIPGIVPIPLQKTEADTFDTEHGAFMDTAAAMMNMDLVITSDTSIAHLAGALGRPVWTCLPFAPEWRWMLNREDSPWYPTMRLFRQKTPGDWADVFARITTELRRLI